MKYYKINIILIKNLYDERENIRNEILKDITGVIIL